VLTTTVPRATAVGVHGDWRLKKARFSISIAPLNVRPRENAASAPATTSVSLGPNSPRS
jgi:hypothetical protein